MRGIGATSVRAVRGVAPGKAVTVPAVSIAGISGDLSPEGEILGYCTTSFEAASAFGLAFTASNPATNFAPSWRLLLRIHLA